MIKTALKRILCSGFVLVLAVFLASCENGHAPNGNEAPDTSTSFGEFLRFGYLDVPNGGWNWADYDRLFDGSYTHLILSVIYPQADGSTLNFDSMMDFNTGFIAAAHAAGTKVLASIGASVTPFATYLAIAGDPAAKDNLINNLLQIIHDKDLDGIDLNFEGQYEGIGRTDMDAVNDLAYSIAEAVKEDDPSNMVTVTLVAAYFLPLGFDCEFVNSDVVDYAHHMSYNFAYGTTTAANGPWRAPGEEIWPHNETKPIERSVYGALKYLVDEGCKVKKLTGGIPFFSAQLELWNQIRDRADWGSIPLHPYYLEKLEDDVKPYNWMNDPEAVAAKVSAYRGFGLGGVMVWQVGQEGAAGDLTEALYDAATAE